MDKVSCSDSALLTDTDQGPVLTFTRAHPGAPDIRRADKSAAGTMPAAAFQYCQAMREASAFGWYVYPPKDIHLLFDGKETFFYEGDQWFPVKSTNFEDEAFRTHWDQTAPADLRDLDPPFLSELFVPGSIQIWSGYFVSSRPGWSTLIRPPVNYDVRSSFSCYEGLVETDHFRPCPLFINIKLLATGREIYIPQDKPLFQVQPIERSCYRDDTLRAEIVDGLGADGTPFDWEGMRGTVRDNTQRDSHRPGTYGAAARRRRKTGASDKSDVGSDF